MAGASADEAKGRAKAAAGEALGDDRLRSEGHVDKAAGKLKGAVGSAAGKVKSLLRRS